MANEYTHTCYLCGEDFDLYKGEGFGESYPSGGLLPSTRYVCIKCDVERKNIKVLEPFGGKE